MRANQPALVQFDRAPSRWPHRLAWLLACATFLLIWMGGLVTSYRAGMSVEDWPTTCGHWFYPIQLWLGACWDMLLEHSHRVLAQAVGVIAIVLAVSLWIADRRMWMRWMAVAVVVGVLVQGTLGGLRVLADNLLLAKVHGCTAPLFFSLAAALVALTSRAWREHALGKGTVPFSSDENWDSPPLTSLPILKRLALAVTAVAYLEIVLGVQLRQPLPDAVPGWFPLWVWLKLLVAGLIAIGAAWVIAGVLRHARNEPILGGSAKLLGAVLLGQLVLGAATWVTNYGWPKWFADSFWAIEYTVAAKGRLQINVTTLHAAVGSLTLAAALGLTLWLHRLGDCPDFRAATRSVGPKMGLSPSLDSAKGTVPFSSDENWDSPPLISSPVLRDYWTLVRPRIIAMVLLSMAVAAWTAGSRPPSWPVLAHALAGTALVIAGAVALNQRMEFRGDARMARTAARPLPSGRLSRRQVTRFGLSASAIGLAYLALATANALLVALTALSWIVYVGTYTPLKSRSAWQTPIGAIAGAMPTLLGAAVADAAFSATALALFGIVYCWQFPHSMAIAWLYRREFTAAEVKVVTVVDPTGRTAGLLAVLAAAALLPVSLLPAMCSSAGWGYVLCASLLGAAYLLLAIRFLAHPGNATARWLLRASLVYLPAVFAALVVGTAR